MNARTTTLAIGVLTVVLGLVGLVAPEFVMEHILGFAVRDLDEVNFVRGEVRAVYGGLFTVLGAFTVLSAMDPGLHRGRILLLGVCWLGLAGGRLLSTVIDGSPGLFGWLSMLLEAVLGGALLASSQVAPMGPPLRDSPAIVPGSEI